MNEWFKEEESAKGCCRRTERIETTDTVQGDVICYASSLSLSLALFFLTDEWNDIIKKRHSSLSNAFIHACLLYFLRSMHGY